METEFSGHICKRHEIWDAFKSEVWVIRELRGTASWTGDIYAAPEGGGWLQKNMAQPQKGTRPFYRYAVSFFLNS